MAAKDKTNPVILDLFKPQGQAPKIYEKLLTWTLSSGKFILIFVELVVIGCFLYRYKLDADLKNLNDQIAIEVNQIKAQQTTEHQIRLTQFQLQSLGQIKNDSLDYPELLTKISQDTPKQTKLTSIEITKQNSAPFPEIIISGGSSNTTEVAALIQALQKDNEFSNITLSSVESNQISTKFSIQGDIIKKGGAKVNNGQP